MSYTEDARLVAKKVGVSGAVSRSVLDGYKEVLFEHLKKDGVARLFGVGTLLVKQLKGGIFRNPVTGGSVERGPIKRIRLRLTGEGKEVEKTL